MAKAPAFLTVRNNVDEQADQVERELAQIIPHRRNEIALPEYLEHNDETPQVGRLSAQALAADFERSANSITKLGEELANLAAKNDAATHRVREIIEYVDQTAAWAREEAKRIFDSVSSSAIFAEEIRRMCETMKQRIAAGDVQIPEEEKKDA